MLFLSSFQSTKCKIKFRSLLGHQGMQCPQAPWWEVLYYWVSATMWPHCVYAASSQPCSEPTKHPAPPNFWHTWLSHLWTTCLTSGPLIYLGFCLLHSLSPCLLIPWTGPFKDQRMESDSVRVPCVKCECHCWFYRDAVKVTRDEDWFKQALSKYSSTTIHYSGTRAKSSFSRKPSLITPIQFDFLLPHSTATDYLCYTFLIKFPGIIL